VREMSDSGYDGACVHGVCAREVNAIKVDFSWPDRKEHN